MQKCCKVQYFENDINISIYEIFGVITAAKILIEIFCDMTLSLSVVSNVSEEPAASIFRIDE